MAIVSRIQAVLVFCLGIVASQAVARAYTESDLTLGRGKWAVGATLTLPAGQGPFPAVVLVHGSGPGKRDLQVGGSAIFRDLAHGLAEHGIAVIRYDKRTTAHKQEYAAEKRRGTLDEEFVADATQAAIALAAQAAVDPDRIFIVGHSQGAGLAPRIANNVTARGAVVLMGSSRGPADLIFQQAMRAFDTAGADPQALAQAREMLATSEQLRHLDLMSPDDQLLRTPVWYWKSSYAVRPLEDIDALLHRGGHVMIVAAGRDTLVTDADFAAWQRAYPPGGPVSYAQYPALNHLMQAGEGKMTDAEYKWTRPVDAKFIADVAQWILSH